jgi:hypothetical protein
MENGQHARRLGLVVGSRHEALHPRLPGLPRGPLPQNQERPQAMIMADALTDGIAKQFPTKV